MRVSTATSELIVAAVLTTTLAESRAAGREVMETQKKGASVGRGNATYIHVSTLRPVNQNNDAFAGYLFVDAILLADGQQIVLFYGRGDSLRNLVNRFAAASVDALRSSGG